METIEMTGATIEEAVAAGMKELGVDSPSQVMVEVLQEPDRGIMGQGARPAKVRLVFMGTRGNEKPTSIISNPNPQTSSSGTQIVTNPYIPPPSPPKQERERGRGRDRDWEREYKDEEEEDTPDTDTEVVAFEQADEDAQVGQQVLDELLLKMEIEGKVVIRKAISTRDGENTHWVLNITGKGMNRLIGRQGETLSSLQYITRLIVSRRLQRRANIIVDAGGYKAKRSDRLKQLANRMADQAVRQHKTVTLEPMPPHERRIIHLTLRKREDVTTRSIGEGDSRKVTISPA
jgi:spoIIIJ-associated protein